MRIAVNTRLLLPGKLYGIGWFTFETFKRITRNHPEHEFIFLFDRPFSDEFIFPGNIQPMVIPPSARHPVLWYAWFEFSVPSALQKCQADIFVSPDGYLSLKSEIPSLSVIHDINFHHRPEDLPFISRQYYRRFFPLFAKKADIIVTVSEFSKQDICSSYSIAPEKVNVVYNGANPVYRPVPDDVQTITRNKYTNGSPYFIFIGSLHPRKNIPRMLFAFDEFRKRLNKPFKMIIVGEPMFLTEDIEQVLTQMHYSKDVIFTGGLLPEVLRDLLGSAVALVFVSLFEGFGIPMVEAMYCDVPVLASSVTSLPEVAGDAALYADPFNVTAISDQMFNLSTDEDLRKRLIEKGRMQRLRYNWDNTAEGLWKNIDMLLKGRTKT